MNVNLDKIRQWIEQAQGQGTNRQVKFEVTPQAGMTVYEWAAAWGVNKDTARDRIRVMKSAGRVTLGKATRVNLRDREYQAGVYRVMECETEEVTG